MLIRPWDAALDTAEWHNPVFRASGHATQPRGRRKGNAPNIG